MRDKCKLCKNLDNHICLVYQRSRSPGKKRSCQYFEAKPLRKKMFAPHSRFKDKKELKKERELRRLEEIQTRKMRTILEQQKLEETSKAEFGSGLATPVMPEKKINIKQNVFSRVVKNMFRRKVI